MLTIWEKSDVVFWVNWRKNELLWQSSTRNYLIGLSRTNKKWREKSKIYIFQNDKMWIYSCLLGFTWFQSHTRQTSKISKYCCWLWIFRYGIQNGTCNRRNISQYGHWKEIKIWHSTFQGFQVWHSTVQGFQIEPNFLTLNWVTYM